MWDLRCISNDTELRKVKLLHQSVLPVRYPDKFYRALRDGPSWLTHGGEEGEERREGQRGALLTQSYLSLYTTI